MESKMIEYPEHEKLKKIIDKSQICGEFYEWLTQQKNIRLSKLHQHTSECFDGEDNLICDRFHNEYYPMKVDIRDLLAEFFGIDQERLNAEKEQMIEYLRKSSKEEK